VWGLAHANSRTNDIPVGSPDHGANDRTICDSNCSSNHFVANFVAHICTLCDANDIANDTCPDAGPNAQPYAGCQVQWSGRTCGVRSTLDGVHGVTNRHRVPCEMRHVHATTHSLAHGQPNDGTDNNSGANRVPYLNVDCNANDSDTNRVPYGGANDQANDSDTNLVSYGCTDGHANDLNNDSHDHHVYHRAWRCHAAARAIFTNGRVHRHRSRSLPLHQLRRQ